MKVSKSSPSDFDLIFVLPADEVPLILHELNDSAIHFISKEQYDRALSLLQKA